MTGRGFALPDDLIIVFPEGDGEYLVCRDDVILETAPTFEAAADKLWRIAFPLIPDAAHALAAEMREQL